MSVQLPTGGRIAGREEDFQLAFDRIHDGYRAHYTSGQRELLEGDHSYAQGLKKLAQCGDLGAVAALADAISLLAYLHTCEQSQLAEKVWNMTVNEVVSGPNPTYAKAKKCLLSGDLSTASELLQSSKESPKK